MRIKRGNTHKHSARAGSDVITRVILRRRQGGQSQKDRFEDATELALKMEEGAINQGML